MAGLNGVGSDLGVRTRSALVMATATLVLTWFGGWAFAAYSAAISAVILWEWRGIVGWRSSLAIPGDCLLLAALVVLIAVEAGLTVALGVTAVFLALALIRGRGDGGQSAGPGWIAGGIVYAVAPGIALALLRGSGASGLWTILFLFAVVWSTDIGAYFIGRVLGGPKLMPAVSPKKTWSGALGGLAVAVIGGLVVAKLAGAGDLVSVVATALALSVISQAGDLGESWLKRRYGVKDSSHLIPGHGGVMDRVDGLGVAAVAALVIGLARSGGVVSAGGMLLW